MLGESEDDLSSSSVNVDDNEEGDRHAGETHEDDDRHGGETPIDTVTTSSSLWSAPLSKNKNNNNTSSATKTTSISNEDGSEELSIIRDFQRAVMTKKGGKKKKATTTTTMTTTTATKIKKTKPKEAGVTSRTPAIHEVTNYVIIRNDHQASHLFRQYKVESNHTRVEKKDRTRYVQITGLTSVRYVEPSSTFIFVQRNDQSDPEELSFISLDNGGRGGGGEPSVYRPISSGITYTGKEADVTYTNGQDSLTVRGQIIQMLTDRMIDLWEISTQTYMRIHYDQISIIPEQHDKYDNNPRWDQLLQTINIPLSKNIDQIYLHYQIRSGVLTWKPHYRALIHPSFQYLISLQCKADISNDMEETLSIQNVKLQMVRQSKTESSVLERRSVAPMMMAAQFSLARPSASSSTPLSSSSESMIQEFLVQLPNHELPPKRECTVNLFTVERVPLMSWYETEVISASSETTDTLHLSFQPVQWFLKLVNIQIQTDTSVLQQKQRRSTKQLLPSASSSAFHWPPGFLQLVLPSTLQSEHIQPNQIHWLTKTVIPSVAKGESTIVSLPPPWSLSTRIKVEIQKTPIPLKEEKEWLAYQVISKLSIQVRYLDRQPLRFPFRIKVEIDASTGVGMEVKLVQAPYWLSLTSSLSSLSASDIMESSSTSTKNVINSTNHNNDRQPAVQWTKDGRYWMLVMDTIPAYFENTLVAELTWTEIQPKSLVAGNVFYRKKRFGGGGGNNDGGSGENKGTDDESTISSSQDLHTQELTPSSIPLPVPVPDDVQED